MGYFSDNANQFKINVKQSEDEIGLRECQAGAYWAVRSHFTADDNPALVSLPTGAGKTALMMLIAFGLKAERVLVVTPTDVLREQTREKFEELDGLKISNTVPDDFEGPEVHKQTSRITSQEEWNELKEYDVVTALPHVISTEYHEDIVAPPDGLFDLVFYDEAHYMRAPSWNKLLNDYEGASQVLLTATPFRRDKRRLPGKLVYFYPLDKAIDSGLYNTVKYESVDVNPATKNEDLRDKAITILDEERENNPDIKLLIRTNSIEEANGLVELYADHDLNIKAVHSKKTSNQNEEALQELRKGDLDGVIGVGMLGEGIDIPSLKIAVFHSPPKSFPFTIQLIGRVARPIEAETLAYVIADPVEMREKGVEDKVRRLYHEDRGWEKLIPELVKQVAGERIENIKTGDTDLFLGANIGDLQPFYSTRLYKVEEMDLDLEAKVSLGEYVSVYRLPPIDELNLLGLITEKMDSPSWAKRTGISFPDYHLHLYYFHSDSETLFEYTTSDLLARDIRPQIVDGPISRLGGEDLVKVMQSKDSMDYLAAGLSNAIGPSGAIPAYKMFLGKSVQGAVTHSDARTFVRGHVFAKIGGQVTRGISDGQGRVWSSGRGNIRQFANWCDSLGKDLVNNEGGEGPTNFTLLSQPKNISNFPCKPAIIVSNPQLEILGLTIFDSDGEKANKKIDRLLLEIKNFLSGARKILRVELELGGDNDPIELRYNIETDSWDLSDRSSLRMRVDYGNEHEDLKLDEFMQKFPAWFYLPERGVIKNGSIYRLETELKKLPDKCRVAGLDWSDCDILSEIETDEADKLSVHDWLENKLEEESGEGDIIFKDHARGEVADFILFDPEEKQVNLYHCKSCPKHTSAPNKGEPNIGATMGHVKDVMDQVIRSNFWVKNSSLLSHINRRNENGVQHFIKNEEVFDEFKNGFVPVEWDYTVFIVNPGLDFEQANTAENTKTLLVTCFEWLNSTGTSFRIMGHENE